MIRKPKKRLKILKHFGSMKQKNTDKVMQKYQCSEINQICQMLNNYRKQKWNSNNLRKNIKWKVIQQALKLDKMWESPLKGLLKIALNNLGQQLRMPHKLKQLQMIQEKRKLNFNQVLAKMQKVQINVVDLSEINLYQQTAYNLMLICSQNLLLSSIWAFHKSYLHIYHYFFHNNSNTLPLQDIQCNHRNPQYGVEVIFILIVILRIVPIRPKIQQQFFANYALFFQSLAQNSYLLLFYSYFLTLSFQIQFFQHQQIFCDHQTQSNRWLAQCLSQLNQDSFPYKKKIKIHLFHEFLFLFQKFHCQLVLM